MKNKILLLFLLISSSIYSQELEPIQADRPDQTETPVIVPKGMFQVETGFTFQKNDAFNKSLSLPSTLWKYGVNENLELRLITEFLSEEINNEKFNGISPVSVGLKVKLTDENGIIPNTSFVGHISLPNAASKEFKTEFFAPEFRFVMQHTLSEKISFS